MTAPAAPTPDTCPRCGSTFACGIAGPGPCLCTTVTLSATLQAQLRTRFQGCLCLVCLRELTAHAVPGATAPCSPDQR